eukprot:NODE_2938_length_1085_cov_47.289575_g2694_i0.p1 GENE.NODE_2938_length_1085_cov_47.289575_g2694_i0~~NODE_2938_length_1085_cov_47.289575_g2694_i0.p1  ORF type:complete len:291 (+),score=83.20 NODE_2938_length_1085_cov_47.289575_g2694_i0:26-898(+)
MSRNPKPRYQPKAPPQDGSDAAEQENAALKAQLNELLKSQAGHETQLEEMNALQQKLQESEVLKTNLQAAIADLKSQLQKAGNAAAKESEQKQRIETLEKQIDTLMADLKEAKAAVASAESNRKDLQRLAGEVKVLEGEKTRVSAELKQEKDKIAVLQNELEAAKSEASGAQSSLNKVQGKASEHEAEIAKLKEALQCAEREVATLQSLQSDKEQAHKAIVEKLGQEKTQLLESKNAAEAERNSLRSAQALAESAAANTGSSGEVTPVRVLSYLAAFAIGTLSAKLVRPR